MILSANLFDAHVRNQGFRDFNRAVRLLIIFENRGDRAPDRYAGTVERVNKFGFGFGVAAEFDIGAASLIIGAV